MAVYVLIGHREGQACKNLAEATDDVGLRLCFPFPRMDLAYGDGTRYAKSCEAV